MSLIDAPNPADKARVATDVDFEIISKKLEAIEREVNAAFDLSPFGSHSLGPDGTYAHMNPLELSWLGCTLQDIVGKKKPSDFLAPESQQKYELHIAIHGNHGFADLGLDLINAHGDLRPVSLSFSGKVGVSGEPQKNRSVLFDLSAIRLKQEMQRIAAIAFESMSGICVTDREGNILRVNAAFTRLTGYSGEEVHGKNMRLLSSGNNDKAFYNLMWAAVQLKGYWQGEMRNRKKDGQLLTEWLNISTVMGSDGKVANYVGTFYDITASKANQAEVSHMAFHDELTQLPNRRKLHQLLEHALIGWSRHGRHSAILFIDLDNFKSLNDTRGHDAGDLLLVEAARRLLSALRDGDSVARIGGDEFVVLLEDLDTELLDSATQARHVGYKLLDILAEPYHIKDFEFRCTASIGISLLSSNESADTLLAHADHAMYQAKKAGRNMLQFFDPVMQTALTQRVTMEQDLYRAITHNEFELHYQPQVNQHKQIVGAEALLRWHHPQRGPVSPGEFIPLAEQSGLILSIGRWVMRTAFEQLKKWEAQPSLKHLSLSINVSARQFLQADFLTLVKKKLAATGANPYLVKLEVTESAVLDIDNAIEKIEALKQIGIRFSLDDFGTGFSSLSSLTKLPIAQLKIDQSFVHNMLVKPHDLIIVQTIIGMAKSMELDLIAEGVETQSQRDELQLSGCHLFQGYLFSKAVPVADFEAMFKHETCNDIQPD